MTTLNELFAAADVIGAKYQSGTERSAYQAELDAVMADIAGMIDPVAYAEESLAISNKALAEIEVAGNMSHALATEALEKYPLL
jgi:hypothetical protein